MSISKDQLLEKARQWFEKQEWKAFPFQEEVWEAYLDGKSGLLNAPTGSGKTYALWLPCLLHYIQNHPDSYKTHKKNGLRIIWITPLRALAKDIQMALQRACSELEVPWEVGLRTGDTSSSHRQRQKKQWPECLITTPESLHIMLSQKGASLIFENLEGFIVDEWHELLGTKRGIQVELALSRIKHLTKKPLRIWGISATIGNLEQAGEILLGTTSSNTVTLIKAQVDKPLEVNSILPDEVENFPWAGRLGTNLLPKVLPIVEESQTTLLFTNTRAQTEIWYQKILEYAPELAGRMAMHHGSIDNNVRQWVEDALHAGSLKLVVCTSSLDLGVDFRPVETVIQVGGPKGVARFLQRAGRSGHQPGATSKIYFLPTHSLELIEGAALKAAIESGLCEDRMPIQLAMDVLIQYLLTLAVSDGFRAEQIYEEIKGTYCFRELSPEGWHWCLQFITEGGDTLQAYDEFSKAIIEEGVYKIINKRMAMRHRLSIGTIVSDPMLKVRMSRGGVLGQVEENFVSLLNPGDVFWFAGRPLKLERIQNLTVYVRPSKAKTGMIPRWMGGRLPLSSQLSTLILQQLAKAKNGEYPYIENETIRPILQLQARWSALPQPDTLLIESFHTKDGHHIIFYPFEGRLVHEVMSSVIAFRISQVTPITFSLAMNDYGFELLSDQEIPLEEALELNLFRTENLREDIYHSINEAEMAQRKFREVATISGLLFQGYPGKSVTFKHLQASSQLLYKVFSEYDPKNLLLRQAMDEVLYYQLEHDRLHHAMKKLEQNTITLTHPPKPTPFSFPIIADRLRSRLSSERLEDRIHKMQVQLENYAHNPRQ